MNANSLTRRTAVISTEAGHSNSQRVLLTTVPSDAHMWNLVFLQLLLEEHGHLVQNMGHCTPVEETVAAAMESQPDVIVVSTVNGHGHLDAPALIERLRSHPNLGNTRVVIGGKLGVDGESNSRHGQALLDGGFDAVFEASAGTDPTKQLIGMLAGTTELPRGSSS